eukprot:629977-Pelagomonas_calceolata.AAC.1
MEAPFSEGADTLNTRCRGNCCLGQASGSVATPTQLVVDGAYARIQHPIYTSHMRPAASPLYSSAVLLHTLATIINGALLNLILAAPFLWDRHAPALGTNSPTLHPGLHHLLFAPDCSRS